MGKSLISSCFPLNPRRQSTITLIYWKNGSTKTLNESRKYVAGEVMFEFPDQMVSHADSFFIGRPILPLAMDDVLIKGETYFVLPIDRFAYKTLTTSSLSIFNPNNAEREREREREPLHPKSPVNFITPSSPPPFEYFHGLNGKVLIKVSPSFIINLIGNSSNKEDEGKSSDICNTPELKKQYVQLVRSKEQTWSPKLETISEREIRTSPYGRLGFNRKQNEKFVL
ncbi:PREDICTED: uncharacterized protein LOC104824621 [Tarenaya hassleriana]|uniref:uncharacterized protein LOC104824621 n=1 Tax=Tarenaya hassleriana TaxID=28532 RepID=UPI00053C83C7|nr:PREDICTED: uncharacterized protein LOC104824621 [Tarenaya hassleriana]